MVKTSELITKGVVIAVDKPLHWTSFDLVNKIRYSLKKKLNVKKLKVGHAGTLDPLASGLMLVCIGAATKKSNALIGLPKKYEGIFILGATTASYDLETDIIPSKNAAIPPAEDIQKIAQSFIGKLAQMPPQHSAKKINGKKAYELARAGKIANLQSKLIEIFDFQIEALSAIEYQFEVHCSSGTYIRSIAHDLGQKANCGAYLSALNRTEIGQITLSNAIQLDALLKIIEKDETQLLNYSIKF